MRRDYRVGGLHASLIVVIVAIAWMYVVVLMALAEGVAPNGSWLGAFFTLLLYGVLPLAIVLYLMATPARRRARLARDRATAGPAATPTPNEAAVEGSAAAPAVDPDGGRHAAGGAVAPKREEA